MLPQRYSRRGLGDRCLIWRMRLFFSGQVGDLFRFNRIFHAGLWKKILLLYLLDDLFGLQLYFSSMKPMSIGKLTKINCWPLKYEGTD